jgi:hypothetical protein
VELIVKGVGCRGGGSERKMEDGRGKMEATEKKEDRRQKRDESEKMGK